MIQTVPLVCMNQTVPLSLHELNSTLVCMDQTVPFSMYELNSTLNMYESNSTPQPAWIKHYP